LAVRLGELVAVGLPHVRQLAYGGYVYNLNAFMYATAVQRRVSCAHQFFAPTIPTSSLFQVPIPSIFVAPKKATKTDEEKTAFAKQVGSAELSKFGQRDVYIIHSPTLEAIMKLPFKDIDVNCPSPPNGTSILGFRSLLTTLKIITLFLSTHTYPAFLSEETSTCAHEYDIMVINSLATKANNDFRYVEDLKSRYEQLGVGSIDLESDTELLEGTLLPETPEWNHMLKDAVIVAKPAPFRPSINFGSPSELPSMPGYIFEYFLGCYIPDTAFVSSMMAECFFHSLGDTKEKASAGYVSWVNGYEKWYKTDAGRIIGHIFLGIKLALQSQSRLFLLTPNGKYTGFALLGHKFSISICGKVIGPDTAEVVRSSAISLDIHSKALEQICKIISMMASKKDSKLTVVKPESVKSMRQLVEEFNKRNEIDDDDDWGIIEKQWNHVNFEERFWPLTHDRIADAIRLIFSNDEISGDLPMFLPAKLIYVRTRITRVLSVFGSMAPSFIDQRGTDIDIPVEGGLDAGAVIDPSSGKRALEVILVSGKRLEAAVDDFHNMVKKRRIRQNFAERAAGFRTMKFNGDARDLLWNALKTMPTPKDQNPKKRGREEDGEDQGGSTAKKGKQREVEDDFTMDF
jgi:hypothetical protein